MGFLAVSKFRDLLSGEEIVAIWRRHRLHYYLTLAKPIFVFALIGIPLYLFFYFDEQMIRAFGGDTYSSVKTIAVIVYVCLFSLDLIKKHIDWKYDNLIVTNQRVIHVDQHFLFGKTIQFAHYADVLDISADSRGLFPTIFKFGTIILETSSAQVNDFKIKFMPNHMQIIRKIQEIQNQFKDDIVVAHPKYHPQEQQIPSQPQTNFQSPTYPQQQQQPQNNYQNYPGNTHHTPNPNYNQQHYPDQNTNKPSQEL